MAIDLDKARAARREARGTGPEIIFGGMTYELSPEIPMAVLDAFGGLVGDNPDPAALAKVAKAILGKHYESFMAMDPPPSLDDLNELIGGAMKEYGVTNPLDSSDS